MADNSTASSKSLNFAGHAVTYAIGNIARQVVGFLMLPVYTRYLVPADYGAVGLLAFALALLEPFFGARLAQAVPKFYYDTNDPDARRAVVSSAIILTGAVSAVTATLIALLRYPASHLLFGTTQYALATGLFGINMLTQPVEYTGMTFIRLQERSKLFLAVSLAKMVLQITLNVLLVVTLRLGVIGVILSGVIASSVVSGGLTAYVAYYNRPKFDWATILRMLKFCWPLWFAGLAGLYIGSSNRLYLRVFDSLQDVGLLELGTKFANVTILLLWTPFALHFETVSYRYHSEGKGQQVFPPAFIFISALMVIAGLGVSIFSQTLINVMSAPAFHAAARTVPLLTLGFTLNCLVGFFYFSFFVTQKTRIFSYCHYLTALVITIGFLAFIPTLGLMGSVLGQCLAFTANFVFVYYLSRRYYDSGIKLAPLGIFLAIATVAYCMSNMVLSVQGLWQEIAAKSAIFLVAACVIAVMALRSVKRASPDAYTAFQSVVSSVLVATRLSKAA
jgi:O-antigen/teichoic acid export membrane protein